MDARTLIRRQENKALVKEAVKEAFKEYVAEVVTDQKIKLADRLITLVVAALTFGALALIAWAQGWFR
jgi:hypothetical protein